jgi:hypothetical protein
MDESSGNSVSSREVRPFAKPAENIPTPCSGLQSSEAQDIPNSIIQAAVDAGGGSLVAYLRQQAEEHPNAFLSLLGKVLSMQKSKAGNAPEHLDFTVRFVGSDEEIQTGRNRDAETNKKTLA